MTYKNMMHTTGARPADLAQNLNSLVIYRRQFVFVPSVLVSDLHTF